MKPLYKVLIVIGVASVITVGTILIVKKAKNPNAAPAKERDLITDPYTEDELAAMAKAEQLKRLYDAEQYNKGKSIAETGGRGGGIRFGYTPPPIPLKIKDRVVTQQTGGQTVTSYNI